MFRVNKMKLKTKTIFVALILIVLVAAFFAIQPLLSTREFIPEEFISAKTRGAEISQKILVLSNASLGGLEQISDLDKAKNYPEAVILISKELTRNREIREEAIKLARQLEKMAGEISRILPAKARQTATEAVSYEVALVSRLISYNDYFNQLFDVLMQKFKYSADGTNDEVQNLINKINDETRAINELNAKFNSAMTEFDKIFQ
jgi:hypothetical protein